MSRRRVYLFGIGSPAWKKATGHEISPLGVPIAVGRSARRLVAKPAATFGFVTSSSVKRPRRRRR